MVDILINNSRWTAGVLPGVCGAEWVVVPLGRSGQRGWPFGGGMTLNGGSGAVQNSQCSVGAAGTSAVLSANRLTLTLNVTYTRSFFGNRVVNAKAPWSRCYEYGMAGGRDVDSAVGMQLTETLCQELGPKELEGK